MEENIRSSPARVQGSCPSRASQHRNTLREALWRQETSVPCLIWPFPLQSFSGSNKNSSPKVITLYIVNSYFVLITPRWKCTSFSFLICKNVTLFICFIFWFKITWKLLFIYLPLFISSFFFTVIILKKSSVWIKCRGGFVEPSF